MKFSDPKFYPLEEFLKCIPKTGLEITYAHLQIFSEMFRLGGIYCETYEETVEVLRKLEEYYQIISLTETPDNGLILRKPNGY